MINLLVERNFLSFFKKSLARIILVMYKPHLPRFENCYCAFFVWLSGTVGGGGKYRNRLRIFKNIIS